MSAVLRSPGDYGRVAVLLGGTTAERDISLQTGGAVCDALRRRGVDAVTLDATGDWFRRLADGGFARVFIALHGRGGEDGVVQGALQTLGLPYTGSGVLGSALAMDKVRSKRLWSAHGLPTPEFIELASDADLERAARELPFPLMVKPVHEGSSCGASKVLHAAGLADAWRAALQYDRRVLAERWITGPEYTAGILWRQPLPLIRLETPRVFYDYQAKYLDDTTRYICPCGLEAGAERELQSLVLRAFDVLGASGWGRVDFMLDETGRPWLLEVNTVPGMTSHSLVPMAAAAAGIPFDELVLRILHTSTAERSAGSAAA
jgi:D-alanine-D-alanine ligase